MVLFFCFVHTRRVGAVCANVSLVDVKTVFLKFKMSVLGWAMVHLNFKHAPPLWEVCNLEIVNIIL